MNTYNLVRCLSENTFFCFNLVETKGLQFEQKALKPEYYFLKKEFVDFEEKLKVSKIPGQPEIIEVSDVESDNIYSIRKMREGRPLVDLVNEKKESVDDLLFRLIDTINFLRLLGKAFISIGGLSYENLYFTETGELEVRNLIPEVFLQDTKNDNNIEELISCVMFGFSHDSINFKLSVISDPVLEEIQKLLNKLKNKEIVENKLDFVSDYLSELVYSNGLIKDQNTFEIAPTIDLSDNKEVVKIGKSRSLIIGKLLILFLVIIGYNLYNHLEQQELILKTRPTPNSIGKNKAVSQEKTKFLPKKVKKEKPKFIKPEMILIKGGNFLMGSDLSENEDEKPAHEVIVNDFYMGKFEVTVGEFKNFVDDMDYVTEIEKVGVSWGFVKGQIDLGTGYSWLNTGFAQKGKQPVVSINWYDALEYCNWLSRVEGLVEYYKIDRTKRDKNNIGGYDTKKWTIVVDKKSTGYRLPTEAEWEFAARAGGKDVKWSECNVRPQIPQYGNIADSSSGLAFKDQDLNDGIEFTANVGSFKPNSLGLYDMTGNVWEMCWDWYYPSFYKGKVKKTPRGSFNGLNRIIRGGGWDYSSEHATVFNRNSISPIHGSCTVGFRLVRNFKK